MTAPTPAVDESEAVVAASTSAQAVVDTANRLGLTWQLRIASLTQSDPPKGRYDGDTVSIGMTSMIGIVPNLTRVYVIQVPPSGNFIVGWVTGPFTARQTLSSTQSSLTFTVPTTLRRIAAYWSARSNAAANLVGVGIQIGGDSSAVYYSEVVFGSNVTASAAPSVAGTSGQIGLATASLAPGSTYGSGQVVFKSWDVTTNFISYDYESTAIGSGAANFRHDSGGGVYLGSGSRTSLTFLCLTGSFISGTDFQVEGWPS